MVWNRFYQSIKPLAYGIDATHGTTPIYQQISNLKDAKSAYGAIVYQKAPSLLRVLAFRIGEDHFREGVRLFLREHAYANAEWNDLIAAFSRASGTDLKPWANAWVEQRGMPQVELDWACDSEQRISSFSITQKDPLGEGHVWPLRTQVLLGHKGAPADLVAASLDTRRGSPSRPPSEGAVPITFSATMKIRLTANFFSILPARPQSSRNLLTSPTHSCGLCSGAPCGTAFGS